MEITNSQVPHKYRNRFLRDSGGVTYVSGGNGSGSGGGGSYAFEPHYLWGQYFDDTQDINGDLTSTGTVTANNVTANNGIQGSQGTFSNGISAQHANVYDITGVQGNFGTLVGTQGYIDGIQGAQANYTNITGTQGNFGTLVGTQGNIDGLQGTNLNYTNITGQQGNFDGVQSSNLSVSVQAFIKALLSEDIACKNLTVTGAAHFFKLIIDEIKSTQGQLIITPANAKLDLVETLTGNAYRCYFRADDADGKKIHNMFEVNDQVICQTFNAATGTNYNISNRYYWRLCTNVSSTPVEKTINGETGIMCHYIDLDNSTNGKDPSSNAAPAAGDEIVMLGNRNPNDNSRKQAIIISAYNSIDQGDSSTNPVIEPIVPPSIVQYKGINDFKLATHRYNVISGGFNSFRGNLSIASGEDIEDLIQSEAYYIGPNGNWWQHGEDTGVSASGEDGTSVYITSQSVQYARSNSGTTTPSSWSNSIPSTGGRYLWTKTTVSYSDGHTTNSYSVGYDGVDGTSVTVSSTSVTYAVTTTSTQPADSSFTYNSIPPVSLGDYVWCKEIVNFSDGAQIKSYSVSRIGEDGEDGTQGANGSCTHFAYATNSSGANFSTTMFNGATWIGTYTDTTVADSTDYRDYDWTQLKGDQGPQGPQGDDGTSVSITSQSVQYARSNSGTTTPSSWSNSIPSSGGRYLWTKTTVSYSDGHTTNSYSVGYDGVDGTSVTVSSTSVTYAVTTTSTQPADSSFTYNSIPPVSLGDYVWCKEIVNFSDGAQIKSYSVSRIGEDGEDGTQGANGSCTHFAYATNSSGANFSTTMFNGATWIGTYTDTTITDSTDYRDYNWTQLKGDKGDTGDSVYIADLSNEMDSISCDDTGHPVNSQSVSTTISLYYGTTAQSFNTPTVKRNGTSITLGTATNGVTVSYSNKVITVSYTNAATISGKDTYQITFTKTGVSGSWTLTFVVNGIVGDVYNLFNDTDAIRAIQGSNNTYTYDGTNTAYPLSCGYTKNVNGTITTVPAFIGDSTNGNQIDGRYQIFFAVRYRDTQTWQKWNGSSAGHDGDSLMYTRFYGADMTISATPKQRSTVDVNTFDAVRFIITYGNDSYTSGRAGNIPIIDEAIIPVIADGAKGDQGAQGPKGDTGNQGATGPQGNQGAQGATGPQGNQGDDGPSPIIEEINPQYGILRTDSDYCLLTTGQSQSVSFEVTVKQGLGNLGVTINSAKVYDSTNHESSYLRATITNNYVRVEPNVMSMPGSQGPNIGQRNMVSINYSYVYTSSTGSALSVTKTDYVYIYSIANGADGTNGTNGSSYVAIYKIAGTDIPYIQSVAVPPTGWSLSPTDDIPRCVTHSGDGVENETGFEGWVVLKGNQQNSVVKEDVIEFDTLNSNTVVTIKICSSSETNYDFMALGVLDQTLTGITASTIKSDSRFADRRISGFNEDTPTDNSLEVNITVANPGHHTIQAFYAKDGSTSRGSDLGAYMVYNVVWMSVGFVSNGSLSGHWSDPVRWNAIDGLNAEYYILEPYTEVANVIVKDNNNNYPEGNLIVVLGYKIKHIYGNNSEYVTPSANDYHILIETDMGNTYPMYTNGTINTYFRVNSGGAISYSNYNFQNPYHTANDPVQFLHVYLVRGTSDTVVAGAEMRYIQVVFASQAVLDVTDSISAVVTGQQDTIDQHTNNIASLTLTQSQIQSTVTKIITGDTSNLWFPACYNSVMQNDANGFILTDILGTTDMCPAAKRQWICNNLNNYGNPIINSTINVTFSEVGSTGGIVYLYSPYYKNEGTNYYTVTFDANIVSQCYLDVCRYSSETNAKGAYKNISSTTEAMQTYQSAGTSPVTKTYNVDVYNFQLTSSTTWFRLRWRMTDYANAYYGNYTFGRFSLRSGQVPAGQFNTWDSNSSTTTSVISQEAGRIYMGLDKAGIEITSGNIKAHADHFSIWNSDLTKQTFSVDANGNLMAAGDAYFGGTIKAKNFYNRICFASKVDNSSSTADYNVHYYGAAALLITNATTFKNDTNVSGYVSQTELNKITTNMLVDLTDTTNWPTLINQYNNNAAFDGAVPCVGDADIVIYTPETADTYNDGRYRILLPPSEKYQGKIIKVYNKAYANNTNVNVRSCINSTDVISPKCYYDNEYEEVRASGSTGQSIGLSQNQFVEMIAVSGGWTALSRTTSDFT